MVARVYGRCKPDTEDRDRWEGVAAARDEAMKKLGYTLGRTKAVGNVQLIRRNKDGKGFDAAGDPRKVGKPAGN